MFSVSIGSTRLKEENPSPFGTFLASPFLEIPSHRTSVKKPLALVVEGNYEAPLCSGSRVKAVI